MSINWNQSWKSEEHACSSYQQAEQQAGAYFARLEQLARERTFISELMSSFEQWGRHHVSSRSWPSFLFRRRQQPDPKDYQRYIQWLEFTGKLDAYLERSISYIYMRDLGKSLNSQQTQQRVRQVVNDVKQQLVHTESGHVRGSEEMISLAGLYRWGQKEGIESAVIWLMDKLKQVAGNIPEGMDAEQAQRKLIKLVVGVVMHVYEELGEDTPTAERTRRLDEAIRVGYSYGLTYPFIDDLLDSQVLTADEKIQYTSMIRSALLTGVVPPLGKWARVNRRMLVYIHSELREAFEYIRNLQRQETQKAFFEQSYIFFRSQEEDRNKVLMFAGYSNEELYVPIILKSAASRIIVRSVLASPEDANYEANMFYYGIYNQLADDFTDMFDDLQEGAVTPYTYYLTHRRQRPDLINPFELYWTVISHLIHHVYHSDPATREVILDRAVNGLKRCRQRLGVSRYEELMAELTYGIPELNETIQYYVRKAGDVDFFDKLLRDQFVQGLRNNKQEREQFKQTVDDIRIQINEQLKIQDSSSPVSLDSPLVEAANYSLNGDGKRLRPVMAWYMGVKRYGLDPAAIMPLLRSLEYMHTASLIFDDLPSQDNAASRRGRPTLHQVHNSATAELTGLFLIQKSIEEQSSLKSFAPDTVLKLIGYCSRRAGDMCLGQAMDLESKGRALRLEELNQLCYYKTGIAFEASLVMPAILAQVSDQEMEALRRYAYHAGIAFQIKDDLLDEEGESQQLGKPVGQDISNNRSTFVTILGNEGAKRAMWEHYCDAEDALKNISGNSAFLQNLLHYLIHRER
ncbi:polyprenyl synthetase family protein [Paenibacillus sp. JX-17]|uniref:Polyprenyl synthetase family protein n=1 Tax=Paenibacillus lacisoli TaxID=3064525 RepID=A0ABT9CFE2_9BACL|nr:polyprenyl synthetase family protein [Paenibacillus sp. JX-17]MDO7907980.1 polyprenyl synthetase family protein [Paenibacillus sp. JX-17]